MGTGREQATWTSGDFAVIGTTLQIIGESLAEAADVWVDERVLETWRRATATPRPLAASRAWSRLTIIALLERLNVSGPEIKQGL